MQTTVQTAKTTRKIHEKQITLEDIYNEIKGMREEIRDRLDRLIAVNIPEETISDEEMKELDRLSEEIDRGEKFSLEDVLAESNV